MCLKNVNGFKRNRERVRDCFFLLGLLLLLLMLMLLPLLLLLKRKQESKAKQERKQEEKKSKQKLVVQADVCANTGEREEENEKHGEDACSIYPTGQWRFEHLIRLDQLPYLPQSFCTMD